MNAPLQRATTTWDLLALACGLLISIPVAQMHAQWNSNTESGTPACIMYDWQSSASIISDGSTGIFVFWLDRRNRPGTFRFDLYVQRFNSYGLPEWNNNGIKLADSLMPGTFIIAVPDNRGGFLMAWERDIYGGTNYARSISVQRRNIYGAMLWELHEVLPYNEPRGDYFAAVTDGEGGMIVAQSYSLPNGESDIFAQRIGVNGDLQWTQPCIAVCDSPGVQQHPVMSPDGNGGAYIAWEDDRSNTVVRETYDIYAQRINADGTMMWAAGGAPVCRSIQIQDEIKMLPSQSGGVFLAWRDERHSNFQTFPDRDDTTSVYAQWLSPQGTCKWDTAGVSVSRGMTWTPQKPFIVNGIQMVHNNNGGAIIAWLTSDNRLWIQGIDSTGARNINSGNALARLIFSNSGFYRYALLSDTQGGGFIFYLENQNNRYTLLSSHIDGSGQLLWDKKTICNSNGIKDVTFHTHLPYAIPDGSGGAFVGWMDSRIDVGDVYVTRMRPAGILFPVEMTSFTARRINRTVLLEWETQSESNNAGFTIQRSIDGMEWSTRGEVKGVGSMQLQRRYEFTDLLGEPDMPGGALHYRLIQRDFDGAETISPSVRVDIETGNDNGGIQLDLYPNPSPGTVELRFQVSHPQQVVISIVNLLGQTIYRETLDALNEGANMHRIEASFLNPGIYGVQIQTAAGIETRLLGKQ